MINDNAANKKLTKVIKYVIRYDIIREVINDTRYLYTTLHAETYKQRLSRRAPIIINNGSAFKLAFGEEYDKLYPGSIYSPPSYNENFSSAGKVKVIDVPLSILPS